MEELQRFGVHTRQRKATLTELGRKWLALHSGGGAPTYALVANDWALMEARTHSPPLHTYLDPVGRAVDPASFVWITKNGYAHARPLTETEQREWPHLAQMAETLWPRPVEEESWQAWERRDHWKERAYFLATMGSRARPQFYGLVEAIYRDGRPSEPSTEMQERDEIAGLYTKLQRYGANSAHWPSAKELGSLIATLDLEHVTAGADCAEARRLYLEERKRKAEEEAAAAARVEATLENAAPIAVEAEPIPLIAKTPGQGVAVPMTPEERLENHAGLAAFRRRHLIPPTFDVRTVAKQCVLASMGAPVPSHLMASAQRRALGTMVTPMASECDAELVNALLDSVPHTKLVEHLNLVSAPLQTYYWSQRDASSLTGHEFVGRLVGDYASNAESSAFRKSYPIPDQSLIKTIIEL